ncbi:ribosomal protein S6 [Abditibacterium utsteinense]|uniref:Small ribosomal subunit protein bS6 n=1 Tax=Abditibacterium utsteinense TaxID=1960156 RepID=A0A2S8SU58_9BACT|nr:30S ribosomal protein S6 [Abditibacterium utsteinense]PQV64334.1 ribosomal protein S6 [Abditibacterium utsteinense]
MADNNSTASAVQEDLAQSENTSPAATQETAPATTPMAPAAQTPAPQAPIVQRVGSDLTPELQPLSSDAPPRKEVEGGRDYEVTFIVVANNPEALDSAQKRVTALIEEGQGAVDNVRVSEVRRLAYPIAKRTEGIYVVLNARFVKALTEDLERFFKLEESVLRHIILRENV